MKDKLPPELMKVVSGCTEGGCTVSGCILSD